MAEVSEGTVVDGRYRVLGRIGSGGMADVYLAEDDQLGRRVALKLLHRRFAEDDQFVERFRREASSAAGLSHPNVVAVYDRGSWDGTYYIAMEYLEGRTLKQVVRDEAPLPPVRAIDLTLPILHAARFAHRRGIVHRDLKPQNVIVDDEGGVKVTDFGIARAGASDMTETGSIMGTAQYLSPEQAQGQDVGERSDLYSVGVILYELLTGKVPFDGDSPVTIALKQVSQDPVPPSELVTGIPPDLEAVVMWAMRKDPADRPQDADAMIRALEAVRERIVTGAEPEGGVVPPAGAAEGGPAKSRAWLWALLIALVLAGGGVLAYELTRPEQRTMPLVVGKDLQTATQIISNAGFTGSPEITRVQSNEAADTVIRQNPLAQSKVDEDAKITLTVSGGPGTAGVPTVEGLTEAAAVKAIRKAGFRPVVRSSPSGDVARGLVIRSSPDAGTQIDRDSTVLLFVSSGRRQVTVPDVVGQSVADARSSLVSKGFAPRTTEQESADRKPGTVLSQSPVGGSQTSEGADVSLVVAKAPAQAKVPNVIGQGVDQAIGAVQDAGFKVKPNLQTVTDQAQNDVVLRQSPAGGGSAKKGSTVTIVVGRFQDTTPTNPTPPASPPGQ